MPLPARPATQANSKTPSFEDADGAKQALATPARDLGDKDAPSAPHLQGAKALEVLKALQSWGDLVTIILHGGCVFEFKGPFPAGSVARGFYNLEGPVPGFHGHIRLDNIDHIGFQDRPHAGRIAHALTFNNTKRETIFKVFLGRDEHGAIWPEQLAHYEALRQSAVYSAHSNSAHSNEVTR